MDTIRILELVLVLGGAALIAAGIIGAIWRSRHTDWTDIN